MCLRRPAIFSCCQTRSALMSSLSPAPRHDRLYVLWISMDLLRLAALWIEHTSGFKHLTRSLRSIWKSQGNNFVKSGKFDLFEDTVSSPFNCMTSLEKAHIVQDHKRSVHPSDSVVPDARMNGHHPWVIVGRRHCVYVRASLRGSNQGPCSAMTLSCRVVSAAQAWDLGGSS